MFFIKDSNIQKSLEEFQTTLYRKALAVPKSCPIPALAYESNSWLMKYRVYYKIINFIKHIHSQESETNLSKQILTEQLKYNWPGQSQIAQKLCEELDISGLFDQQISKAKFKLIVKKACQEKNDQDLRNQIQTYKKMSALRDEMKKEILIFLMKP